MEDIISLATAEDLTSQPTTPISSIDEFPRETFSNGNGEEIVIEALEKAMDGKDENCKSCQ